MGTKNISAERKNNGLFLALVLTLCTPLLNAEFVADGVRLTALTDDGRSKAVAWAYHGGWVSFIRAIPGSRQNQLYIMMSDGSGKQAVTPIGDTFFAEWSWEGNRLSYLFSNTQEDESQGGASFYDLTTGRSYAISAPYLRDTLDEDEGPIWSPNDRFLAYKARPGASRLREVWVHDSLTNKTSRILADRGEVREAHWSGTLPVRLCVRVKATNAWDLASVRPDGQQMIQLTNIGAESLDVDNARWSPTQDWIAFTYNKDMTQMERDSGRSDCWIGRPDGSDARNLTQATSVATEKQLELHELFWSWDGRWILATGERFDIQGSGIETLYLVDPQNGGYRILLTSYPRETSELERFLAFAWSYDSQRLALLSERRTVRNWGGQAAYEQNRTVLSLYDMTTETRTELLIFSHEQDRKRLLGETERDPIEGLSWSPDSRSVLLTLAKIISQSDGILQTDVYRVDLPELLISPEAAAHDGPVIGRGYVPAVPSATAEQALSSNGSTDETTPPDIAETATAQKTGNVIDAIIPQHISIEETLASLPNRYKQYLTPGTSLNLLVFEGPAEALASIRTLLTLVDREAPQILVDLLAVELTEEANRQLGLDWTYAEGHIGLFQPVGNAIRDLTPDSSLDGLSTYPGAGQMFYQGVGNLPREFFFRLNALVADGKGTILANPRTVATSGQEAVIQIRKTLNYFFNEGYDTAGRPIVKKSDISSDTQGRITPTLLADSRIRMVVDVKVGSFTFSQIGRASCRERV